MPSAPSGPERTAALAHQLAAVHDGLRVRVRDIREALDQHDGDAAGADIVDGTRLLEHCLGFCHALQAHHTGEDDGLFLALRTERPDLAPMLDKLIEDHHLIAGILARVHGIAGQAGSGLDDPARIRLRGELDGLMAIMDSHFAFEERSIGAALDGLTDRSWTATVLDAGR